MEPIRILTKNKGKYECAKNTLTKFGIKVIQETKDFPEIQADTSLEIARYTAINASKVLKAPVIREDHSLFINALGFPGPYMNFIERSTPSEILLKILSPFKDRSGYFELALVYADQTGIVKEFSYKVPIHFSSKIKGSLSDEWNKLIMLKDEKRTLAEYPETERENVWNKNYIQLAKFIGANNL